MAFLWFQSLSGRSQGPPGGLGVLATHFLFNQIRPCFICLIFGVKFYLEKECHYYNKKQCFRYLSQFAFCLVQAQTAFILTILIASQGREEPGEGGEVGWLSSVALKKTRGQLGCGSHWMGTNPELSSYTSQTNQMKSTGAETSGQFQSVDEGASLTTGTDHCAPEKTLRLGLLSRPDLILFLFSPLTENVSLQSQIMTKEN